MPIGCMKQAAVTAPFRLAKASRASASTAKLNLSKRPFDPQWPMSSEEALKSAVSRSIAQSTARRDTRFAPPLDSRSTRRRLSRKGLGPDFGKRRLEAELGDPLLEVTQLQERAIRPEQSGGIGAIN